jgi:hypothetical protein
MADPNQKHPPSFPPAYPGAFESLDGDGSPGDPIMCLDEVAASRENHSDNEMEDRCMPEGDFRTDLRRKRKYTESRKKLLEDFEVLLETIKKYPYIWLEDDVQFLRDFVATVNNDQENFPPALPPGGQANELSLMTDSTPPLDKDFVSKIYSRHILSDMDCRPIGLVTACSSSFREIQQSRLHKTKQRKIYTLHVADGDKNVVTVKVASQLNSIMHRVTVGSVIKLLRYNPVPFKQSNLVGAQLRIALILTNFEICGTMEVDETLKTHPGERLEVHVIPAGQPAEVVGASTEAMTSFGGKVGGTSEGAATFGGEIGASAGATIFGGKVQLAHKSEVAKYVDPYLNELWKDPSQWEPVENPVCSADNRLCSKYGVRFDMCVCDAIPIPRQDLFHCAHDCPFVTMEIREMSNTRKRNLLDWWYMTNVYSICGKDKRRELPTCLLWRI